MGSRRRCSFQNSTTRFPLREVRIVARGSHTSPFTSSLAPPHSKATGAGRTLNKSTNLRVESLEAVPVRPPYLRLCSRAPCVAAAPQLCRRVVARSRRGVWKKCAVVLGHRAGRHLRVARYVWQVAVRASERRGRPPRAEYPTDVATMFPGVATIPPAAHHPNTRRFNDRSRSQKLANPPPR